MPTQRTNNVSGGTMTRKVCLPLAVAAFACLPVAAIAQSVDTPGVTQPLTAAQHKGLAGHAGRIPNQPNIIPHS